MDNALSYRDRQLLSLVEQVALALPSFYDHSAKKRLTEQAHLQPVTDRVLEQLMPTWSGATPAGRAFPSRLKWIGTGDFDVAFRWPDQLPTVIELKCDTDLSACVWDAVKLAAASVDGHINDAYLVAASPTAMWNKPTPGASLFTTETWETMGPHIRGAHLNWWLRWQEETTRSNHEPPRRKPNRHIPGLIARTFTTVAVGEHPFTIEDTPWELRIARVAASRLETTVWKCVTAGQ